MKQVTCHKCHTPNQLGSVFCRSCGAKLKLSEKDLGIKQKSQVIPFIKRLFKIVIFLGGLGVAAMAFVPWGLPEIKHVSDEQEKQHLQKICAKIDETLQKNNSVL